MTALARTALTTAIDGLDRDTIALLHVGHATPRLGDHTGELVADDHRHGLAGERVRLGRRDEDRPVVVLVQICAADAVAADLDLDPALVGRRLRDVLVSSFWLP
jgi:hypothetical protein